VNHPDAWALLPWLANDRLAGAQRSLLEEHLGHCAACREELRTQRALLAAIRSSPQLEAMPPTSLQKLWARLDTGIHPLAAQAMNGLKARRRPRRRKSVPALLAAGAACIALVAGAVLSAVLLPRQAGPASEYRTVSDAVASTATAGIRAVFAAELELGDLQQLLGQTGLRIVDGPSASGVYTLAATSAEHDPGAALSALRAHPAVRFAEPLEP
jgi:hypothetical protein